MHKSITLFLFKTMFCNKSYKDIMEYKKVFFVGINGVSMSALAFLTFKMGIDVAGSDKNCGKFANKLKKMGIKVYTTHRKNNIKGCDLVVFSGAIGDDNNELIQAKRLNIKTMERSQYLGLISQSYGNVIAISGSHGKTTTTAMIGYIFLLAGLNPTVHIGGELKIFGGNLLVGGKQFFITEACEFRDSFLELKPNVSVVTNIEKEHLDFFKTFKNEVASFKKFVNNTKIKCFANEKTKEFLDSNLKISFCGIDDFSNWQAKNIKIKENGKYSFDVFYNGKYIDKISLGVAGKFNVDNALLAIAVSQFYGIKMDIIKKALVTFCNVDRRFEKLGEKNGNIVVQDYAHHPTEIAKVIQMCKEVYKKKIVCIFQPHTYSRTKMLIDDFLSCFDSVKELIILHTYSAREKYSYLGSAKYLKDKLFSQNKDFTLVGPLSKQDVKIQLEKYKDCILLFLGAGDIDECAKGYIEANFNKKL